MGKSGKKGKSAKPKKRRKIQFELVVTPNFLDMMYESMASEQWELDHKRKPSDYIR